MSYTVDYYYAQVMNGGHTQYCSNIGSNLFLNIALITEGLQNIGAANHLNVFQKLKTWLENNKNNLPTPMHYKGWLEKTREAFAPLDDDFFKLDKTTALYALNVSWISKWPNLEIVDDADYPAALQKYIDANPHREARQRRKTVEIIAAQLNDNLRIGFGLTSSQSPSGREILQAIGAGQYFDVHGQSIPHFKVITDHGTRFGTITEEGCKLYEAINADQPMPTMEEMSRLPSSEKLSQLAKIKPISPGRLINETPMSEIEAFKQYAIMFDAAVAISMMLKTLNISIDQCFISPLILKRTNNNSRELAFLIATQDSGLVATCKQEGAYIIDIINNMVACKFSAAEIHAYREQILR